MKYIGYIEPNLFFFETNNYDEEVTARKFLAELQELWPNDVDKQRWRYSMIGSFCQKTWRSLDFNQLSLAILSDIPELSVYLKLKYA